MTVTHDTKAFRRWYMMLAVAWALVILQSVFNFFWALHGTKSVILLLASLPLPLVVKAGLFAGIEQSGSEAGIPPTREQRMFLLLGGTLGSIVLSLLQTILWNWNIKS